ncbi:MAG: DNA mismatch repair endonuclease MutL [Gemmatimonadaceae bacterium]|nr:DNA mismatch repair endonuclease MutL [Gemmatimonadaceae bacterium]
MSRISILPSAVADQIAAGEVVERPASVVKELVENALDAGAHTIEVTIEDGGRRLIRVSDDGSGMDRDDASLALARHGTSKIRAASDLVSIASFGFRGEALPAIASVSELELETSDSGDGGTRVEVRGGSMIGATEAARRQGTTVTVRNLFNNVPARLKFMKSARSEWRSISDTLTSIAVSRRDIRLIATHDGRKALDIAPSPTLRARLGEIWSSNYASKLVEVEDLTGPIHTTGLVERPSDVGTASRRVIISLNGRVIRDTGMVRAAEAAYRSTIAPGLRPSLFLSITIPAESVDVNVHPAKAEVRFRDRWTIERAVENAVRRALGTMESAASFGRPSWLPVANPTAAPQPFEESRAFVQSAYANGIGFQAADGVTGRDEPDASATYGEREPAEPIPPLLQLRRTYIMFEHADGVVLIDQHSAHERILFEKFMRGMEQGGGGGQRLLLPLTLHLDPDEAEALDANRDYFIKLGYEIEDFGSNTVLVSCVPTPHARFDAERCLRDTLSALTGSRNPGTAAKHEYLAATFACKAAIKAGEELSQSEMRALFTSLRDTQLPAHDVHGRSTIVQLSWDELERKFGRK